MSKINRDTIHNFSRHAAVIFLEELSVTDFIGPVIEEIVKFKGIHLIYDTIYDPEALGFSTQKMNEKFIFINSNFNERLQKFTIAHEIYHLDDNIDPLKNTKEDERAADHFAANLLLPEKIVFEKQRMLKSLGYDEIEIFFILTDLSQVPYETLYKRYKELSLSVSKINKELKKIVLSVEDPYLKEIENKLQVLRKSWGIGGSHLDLASSKKRFESLEILSKSIAESEKEAPND